MTTHDRLCIKNFNRNYSVICWGFFVWLVVFVCLSFISCCVRELRIIPRLNDEQKKQRHTAHTFPAVGAGLSPNNTKGGFKGQSADVDLRKINAGTHRARGDAQQAG